MCIVAFDDQPLVQLCYNNYHSLKLDNWFCVVQLPPTLLWAGGFSFTGRSGESSSKNGRQDLCRGPGQINHRR